MNPLFLIDFYKVGHYKQYPPGLTRVWSNWTPRYSRHAERHGAIHFGVSYLLQKFLHKAFRDDFFRLPKSVVIAEYKELIGKTLGDPNPDTSHLEALHDYQRLPLDIYSLPEGTFTPCGVPAIVIVNTDPRFFWLPNYIETLLSNILWMASTSATTASIYREIFENSAIAFGESDLSFVDWMGHDFSMRGLSGIESAQLSGMGHLTSFSGTDSVPAIVAANQYYGSGLNIGGSVPATEHSVMCAGGNESELQTFERLITECYPNGVVSIVSDTWDLWRVMTDYLPRLKDKILARDGKVVIRPDSGDPAKILCGNPDSTYGPERAGVLRLLAEVMGTDGQGHINKAGAIYGDSITPERAKAITSSMVNDLKLSPYNCVFGIGSYTYQYVTRDTYGFAMKATAVEKDGAVIPIFKDPVTDDGSKRSLKGIPIVYERDQFGTLACSCSTDPLDLPESVMVKVFGDGQALNYPAFNTVRALSRKSWRKYQ